MIAQQQNEGGGSPTGSGRDAQTMKKGPWTAAEDAILADYVRTHGEGNWNAVQKNTGLNRCGKSCRLRWANHLRPNLKKGSFTPEEERLIVELHSKLGNKWARMAAQMPGRTDNEIKNYWNTRLKRRMRQGLPLYPPDIQPLHHHGQQQSPFPGPSLSSATTTSTCSFSFQTPYQLSPQAMNSVSDLYTTSNQFMHLPPLQSPNSPTPPPFHMPYENHFAASAHIRSPSQSATQPRLYNPNGPSLTVSPHPAYPTLSLLNTASSNILPRSPPSLQLPARIKRFRCDDGESYGDFGSSTDFSTGGTFMSCPTNSSTMFSFPSLPKSSVLTSSVASTTTDALPHPEIPSFSLDPASFNTTSASRVLRTQFDQGQIASDHGLASQIKAELPSSQILSQDHNSEIQYDTKIEESIPDHNQHGLVVGGNGMGDFLEDAQVLASSSDSFSLHDCSNMQDSNHFLVLPKSESGASISGDHTSVSYPEKESGDQLGISPEDLSKLLKGVPLSEWYSSGGEASNGHSSDGDPGLELNRMTSFLKGDIFCDNVMAPDSCSWDNLPQFC